jgi:hypothetical protein
MALITMHAMPDGIGDARYGAAEGGWNGGLQFTSPKSPRI